MPDLLNAIFEVATAAIVLYMLFRFDRHERRIDTLERRL